MDDIRIPDDWLRYRIVSQTHSAQDYLNVGVWSVQSLVAAFRAADVNTDRFRTVLDFGCGCGRTVQHVRKWLPKATLHGTDIDAPAIEWCANNLPYAAFQTNDPQPPLKYAANSFDLVYALSVFSHLDEPVQDAWLAEMHRVLAPGGHLYFTFSGPIVMTTHRAHFDPERRAEYDRKGFTFVRNILDGVLPDWYQTSIQTIDYLKPRLPAGLDFVSHKLQGHSGWQDCVVVRKR